jgi:hypothetical protein
VIVPDGTRFTEPSDAESGAELDAVEAESASA